jgi:hypothetical protein
VIGRSHSLFRQVGLKVKAWLFYNQFKRNLKTLENKKSQSRVKLNQMSKTLKINNNRLKGVAMMKMKRIQSFTVPVGEFLISPIEQFSASNQLSPSSDSYD